MASRDRRGGFFQDIRTLFDTGTTDGLTDGELLRQFADRRAEDDTGGPAFAALVGRHGPMVLRVCRSILRDEDDARDAFQATFLVLVRRADAVRRRESAGSWLHGVALRVAAHARAGLARRRRHERCAGELAAKADRSGAGRVSPELAAVLHEELGRLPERYRAALVLCYLEGHTCESAARRLGWPVGTVQEPPCPGSRTPARTADSPRSGSERHRLRVPLKSRPAASRRALPKPDRRRHAGRCLERTRGATAWTTSHH